MTTNPTSISVEAPSLEEQIAWFESEFAFSRKHTWEELWKATRATLRSCAQNERDARRLDWIAQLQPWDELCGIDIHDKAFDFAVAGNREEILTEDYGAALRFQIDHAMKEDGNGK